MSIHAMDLAPVSGGAYGEPQEPRRPVVVVGYDGSVASHSAVGYAIRRAGRTGRVVAVHACGPGRWAFGAGHSERDHRSAGAALLAGLAERMPKGVSLEPILTDGPVPKALVDAAREHRADEIVVGVHGRDARERGLGGVPLALLALADLPVVVVPARTKRSDEPGG
jgi:nucleotide-binding universal stress UspA family protein